MKDNAFDVVIVGGGILGVSHAYHCLQAGLKVAILERDGAPQGASVRNFGQVVPSGFGATWQQLGRKSLECYKEIQAKADISVRQEGTIYVASDESEEQLLQELAEINKGNDYTSQLLSQEECLARYPLLKSCYVRCGLLFPEEVIVDPSVAVNRITDYCKDMLGLAYFSRHAVVEISQGSDRVHVFTSAGRIFTANKVLVCSGSDFSTLYPELFRTSPIRLVKLQMMDTVPQKQARLQGSLLTGWTIRRYESFKECPSYAEIKAKEDAFSFQREHGIHILFKQSPDGSVIIGDSHHYAPVDQPELVDYKTDSEINNFMLSQAQRIVDLDDWRIRRTWLGFYSETTQGDIFNTTIGNNIHIVTAIGGKGMTGALGYAAKHISEILSINQHTY